MFTFIPHPLLHSTTTLGLCSQAATWVRNSSRASIWAQPLCEKVHLIFRRDSMLRIRRETGTRCEVSSPERSTGQICFWIIHLSMQARQKACSHSDDWTGSSRTSVQIGQMSSSSTWPTMQFRSKPMTKWFDFDTEVYVAGESEMLFFLAWSHSHPLTTEFDMYLYLYPKLDFYNISIKKLVFTSALSCVRAGI